MFNYLDVAVWTDDSAVANVTVFSFKVTYVNPSITITCDAPSTAFFVQYLSELHLGMVTVLYHPDFIVVLLRLWFFMNHPVKNTTVNVWNFPIKFVVNKITCLADALEISISFHVVIISLKLYSLAPYFNSLVPMVNSHLGSL